MDICRSEQRGRGNITNQIQSRKAFTQLPEYPLIFTLSLTPSAPQGEGAVTTRSRLEHVFWLSRRRDPVVTLLVVEQIQIDFIPFQIETMANSKYPIE